MCECRRPQDRDADHSVSKKVSKIFYSAQCQPVAESEALLRAARGTEGLLETVV